MGIFRIHFSIFTSLYRLLRNRLFRLSAVALAGALLLPCTTVAQFKFRQTPNRQDPDSLSRFEENLLWREFKQARSVGKFVLAGSLNYRPAGSPSTSFAFTLEGDWNAFRHYSRLQLKDNSGVEFNKEIVIRDNSAFLLDSDSPCSREIPIDKGDMSEPLIANLPFTWNDILMPYLSWENVLYIGPDRYLGRPAHKYTLSSNNADDIVQRVIVTLDEDYAVLLKSDVLDKNDNIIKRMRVSGFKQFGDDWMFSELVWEHRQSRESVVLKISRFDLLN